MSDQVCENSHPMVKVTLGGYHCPRCERAMEVTKKHCLRLEEMGGRQLKRGADIIGLIGGIIKHGMSPRERTDNGKISGGIERSVGWSDHPYA